LIPKCLDPEEASYALDEVHKGIAEQHLEGHAMARKMLRAGYY